VGVATPCRDVYGFAAGSSDNGNVLSILNCLDPNRNVNFTYDPLNRIESAATQGTTCSYCWGQLFGQIVSGQYVSGYDAWGNLNQITATQGSPTVLSQAVTPYNNRFSSMTYNADGALKNDGTNAYTYNDSEGRVSETSITVGRDSIMQRSGEQNRSVTRMLVAVALVLLVLPATVIAGQQPKIYPEVGKIIAGGLSQHTVNRPPMGSMGNTVQTKYSHTYKVETESRTYELDCGKVSAWHSTGKGCGGRTPLEIGDSIQFRRERTRSTYFCPTARRRDCEFSARN
jgi:hypothetical protein